MITLCCSGMYFSEEHPVNLAQAVGPGQVASAYRVVGTQRIVVEPGQQRLRVLVQSWNKRRWIIPEQVTSIRYLNGVLRDGDGSWIVACSDLAALVSIEHCLPPEYQHLLTPTSNDWQTLKAG